MKQRISVVSKLSWTLILLEVRLSLCVNGWT